MKKFLVYLLLSTTILTTVSITAYSDFDPLGGLSGGKKFDQPAPAPKPASAPTPQPVSPSPSTPANDVNTPANPQPEPEQEKPQPEKADAAATEDDLALTFAECLIMEQLEIQDDRCDRLKQAINCPEYTACILDYGKEKNNCFANCNAVTGGGKPCNTCRELYNTSLAICEKVDPSCAGKYPTKRLTVSRSSLGMLDASGDVRITYQDNPKASDMKSLGEGGEETEALVGATIFTGDNGQTTLRFSDNSTAYVGPGSYFRIDDFYTSETFEESSAFLKNGSVRVNIATNNNNGKMKYSYVVMTPLWKAKAKGTEFEIKIADDGSAKLETFSGKVEILDYEDNLIATVIAGGNYESKPVIRPDDKNTTASDLTTSDEESSGIIYDFFEEQNKRKIILAAEIIGGLLVIGVVYFGIRRFRK